MSYDHQIAYYKELFDKFDLDILDKYTLVFENTLTKNLDEDLIILRDIINTSNKKVLLMYDSNPSWYFEDYFELLAKHIDNVYLSSADLLNLWNSHPRIVYFPTFYFTQLQETNYQSLDKKYRFSFLSNKPRFHRIYCYHKIKDAISDDDVVSVNNSAFGRGWWKESYIVNMKTVIGSYDKTIEEGLPFITNNALLCNKQLTHPTDHLNNKHIAYNAYFNITGESNIVPNKVFLTEKTWKAVFSGVVPIFLESNSTFDALERIGFEFVNAVNIKNVGYLGKIAHINACVKTYDMHKTNRFYSKLLPQINKNIERFYSNALINIFTEHIRDKLKV